MTEHLDLRPHKVIREDREDGAILLRSGYERSQVAPSTGAWLDHWARAAPDRVFLAERSGEGWRQVSYAEARGEVMRLARGLLDLGLGPDRPLVILSGNSVDHALLGLAAQYVGVPCAPVAEQYSLIPAAHGRLQHVLALIDPAAIYAEDGAAYGAALALPEMAGRRILCSRNVPDGAVALDRLDGTGDVAAAHAAVGPDTVAKYLLTSGSTSEPKAVVTTQRMMTTNQAMIRDGLPFVAAKPPVLVDWLPWNHVFGGSHNFNLVLANGGSLYIDHGKPLPALFPRTVENLGLVAGTISFNVPVGFAQLVEALRADADLARTYFRELDMIFYAGASLPQDTWSALEDLALRQAGRLPLITSSWGLTETAPAALLQHEPGRGAGIVGVPLPGITVKLIPEADGRMEIRLQGDSVFTEYLRNPGKTAEAFDEEGFFITGDAMRFVDPEDMSRGLRFDGRISEDFKLMTGTWVQAANLRLEMLPVLAPFAQDVAVTGAGRNEVGVLIVPNRAAILAAGHSTEEDGGALVSAELQSELSRRMAEAAARTTGSAKRVVRALILAEPPSMGDGEVTAKGNLNFAKLLQRRAELVDRLYDDTDRAVIRV